MKNNTNVVLLVAVLISFAIGFFSGKLYEEKRLNQDGFTIQGPGWKVETRPEGVFEKGSEVKWTN